MDEMASTDAESDANATIAPLRRRKRTPEREWPEPPAAASHLSHSQPPDGSFGKPLAGGERVETGVGERAKRDELSANNTLE